MVFRKDAEFPNRAADARTRRHHDTTLDLAEHGLHLGNRCGLDDEFDGLGRRRAGDRKAVAAVGGQRINVGACVSIDGRPLPHSDVRRADAAGRPLSPFAGGVVPAGALFLHSDFAGSYDSRYFGPIPVSGVLGLAHPIFTFGP
jgi:hypothetical protein